MFAVNSGDQVTCTGLQVHQRLRTHRFGYINGQSNGHAGSLFRLVSDVFGTNAEDDIFVDVFVREGFQTAFERERQSVFVAPFHKEQAAIAPLDLALQEVHRRTADEASNEEIFRLPVKSQRIGYLHDETVAHDANAITHGHRLNLVMGNVNHGITELSVEFGNLRAHLHTHLGVQVRQWFVEKKHLRAAHNSSPQSHALTLAAGQSAWFALQHMVKTKGLRGSSNGLGNKIFLLLGQLKAERHVVE